MWYEHGQSERLINLDQVKSIQITKTRDALMLEGKIGDRIVLEFADEAETTEVYHYLRVRLTLNPAINIQNIPFLAGG